MVDTVQALVPWRQLDLVAPDSDESWTRLLFDSFHAIFAPERLLERVVFWVEEKGSHLVLRYVTNLQRTRKADDRVIGRTANDLAAARVLVGNYAAGAKMTTVRWEIYKDFELQDLADSGRFAYSDLLYDITPEKARALTQIGTKPVGDWDFDAIMLLHKCIKCGRVFDSKSVVYNPQKPCESCGRIPSDDDSFMIVRELLRGYRQRLDTFSALRAEGDPTHLQAYLDPVPNSIASWLLWHTYAINNAHGSDMFKGLTPWLEVTKQHSLFGAVTSGILRDHLITTLDRSGMDMAIIVNAWRRVGEALRQNFRDLGSCELGYDVSVQRLVCETFPGIVNEIIVNCGMPSNS